MMCQMCQTMPAHEKFPLLNFLLNVLTTLDVVTLCHEQAGKRGLIVSHNCFKVALFGKTLIPARTPTNAFTATPCLHGIGSMMSQGHHENR